MEASRRDFMQFVVGGFGAVAGIGVLYPILKSLSPSAAAALQAKVNYDVSQLKPMDLRVTSWKGFPIVVMNLPQDVITGWHGPEKEDHNRKILGNHNVFALIGKCTHLGCIPLWKPTGDPSMNPSNIPAFHCPCHGSIYTPWGDNILGPAPLPLGIPPQNLNGNILEIGTPGFVKDFYNPYT